MQENVLNVNGTFSEEFVVEVGVHPGSVLSPLLFIYRTTREFKSGCTHELLYADGLVLFAENMEELNEKYKKSKEGMESKALWINMKKTKIMLIDCETESVRSSGKRPCGKGVGCNSIFCDFCKHWVHKRYIRMKEG